MEFKGTKGEWEFTKDPASNGWTSVFLKGTNHEICTCYTGTEIPDFDELEANAQLIATAPELLKALRYILDQKENEHCSTYMDEVCEYAEKVINKALGND